MEYADIEYSKKLKDLFPESEYRIRVYRDGIGDLEITERDYKVYDVNSKVVEDYPALTTDMLLERLPWWICHGKCSPDCDKGNYWCEPWSGDIDHIEYADKSPNELAKMLCYLQQKGMCDD